MPEVSGSFCIFSGHRPAAPQVTAPAAPDHAIAACPPSKSARPTTDLRHQLVDVDVVVARLLTPAITSGRGREPPSIV